MDRFIMNTDLPGVIAGRMLSKRALRGTSTGQKMTLLLSSVCRFGSSVPMCRGSSGLLGACTLCAHPCITYVIAFVCVQAKQMHVNYIN